MRLRTARIQGFQSFADSGEIIFRDGINLVIGQNNAGKSAMLRALLPGIPDDRHRTPERWETFRLPPPKVTLSIEANGSEIRDWVLQSGNPQYIPIPPANSQQSGPSIISQILDHPGFHVVVSHVPGSSFFSEYPSHQLFKPGNSHTCIGLRPENGEFHYDSLNGNQDSLPTLFWDAWHRDMFYFAPERLTIGESGVGYGARLQPNASNLPNVLHTLSSERGGVFQRLIRHLNAVFSTVGNLSVRTKPENHRLAN
jgi:hypothetical protein